MPILDTSLLIDLAEGHVRASKALERARRDGPLILPAHAALEFLSGVEDSLGDLHALKEAYDLKQTTETMLLAGARLRKQARAKGHARPNWGDVHIAAEADLAKTYVITANKRDFTQLGVQSWDYLAEPEPPQP